MVGKIVLTLCVLLVVGTLYCDAQRDGRRRSGRRKPTTEIPPVEDEPIKEKKNEAEPEAVSSTQESESQQTPAPLADKETVNSSSQGGPPFIVPRGTRKPRPHVRNSGESRPRPTLPTFARKRGPKSNQQELKKNDENVVSTTTPKPSRASSRSHSNTSQKENKNVNAEKTPEATDEEATEEPPKRRFGGGSRRQSRGNRRQNVES